MTMITERQEQFIIDYQAEQLSSVFIQQNTDCDFSSSTLLQTDSSNFINQLQQAKLTLLIACERIVDDSIIRTLQEKADEGIRIYVLLGDKKSNQTAIDTLSSRCLIRTGVKQQGALMLIDHATSNASGLLITDQEILTNESINSDCLSLERQQIDDSFRSFCKLFWENSQAEYYQHNKSANTTSHPDGNIITNHSHHLNGTLSDCLDETFNNLRLTSNYFINDKSQTYLSLLPIHTSTKDIEEIAGEQVALSEQALPTVLLSSTDSWLLPAKPNFEHTNWCICLSEEQSTKITPLLSQAFKNAAWQFKKAIDLKDLPDQQTLRFSDQPDLVRCIESNRNKTLDDIKTDTIDSFLHDSAKALSSKMTELQRGLLAHNIHFQVTIHPPYCPKAAKVDPLHNQWKQAEATWKNELEKLEKHQTSIDQKQGNLSDKFKGFIKGFLLGQGQSTKEINQKITDLKGWSVSHATPAEREDYRKQLESLQTNVSDRDQQTDVEIDKSKKNQQWQDKRIQLDNDLKEKKAALNAKESDLLSLQKEESSHKNQAEEAFTKSWKKAVDELTEDKLDKAVVGDISSKQFIPEKLPKEKDKIAPIETSANKKAIDKKKEALLSMNLQEAEKWGKTLKNNFKKHYPKLSRAIEDYEQAINKIKRDIADAEKSQNQAEKNLNSAQSSRDSHGNSFIYQPEKKSKAFDKQLGLKDKKTTPIQYSWPNEELPNNEAVLKRANNKRWLVIINEEQIEQAIIDAERLSATVCIEQEN